MRTCHVLLLLTALFFTNNLIAQAFFAPKKYPRGNYRNPVSIPVSLAGNFGECRPNHFHSGLDVRTNKVENIPIYSIYDGYISRIKIDAGGFGNAIYLTHTDGYTSLYAHLNKFYPELENFVRFQQYRQKKWNIDITLLPHEFPLRKGTFLAYSGNTGSSQAPHLHMEIRNTKTEKPLNGLLFYNYVDTRAPLVKKLAVYNGQQSVYAQTPKQLNCIVKNGVYIPGTDTIKTTNKVIAFGVVADDPMEEALGVLGVYEMNMYLDDKAYFGWQLDNIGYDETRYMNAQADYKVKKNGGPWIQLCYKLPQDKLEIYKSNNMLNGKISLEDGLTHKVKIILKDVKGNSSTMQFYVRNIGAPSIGNSNLLRANAPAPFNDGNVAFALKSGDIYDDVPLQISNVGNLYKVNTSDVPVHNYFDLKLKPKMAIAPNLASKVALVRYPYGKDTDKKGVAGKLVNGWAVASVRDFGTYEVVVDQTPPVVTCAVLNGATVKGKYITCSAKDETTSVKSFVGTIDNQWVRFVQKGKNYTYEIDKYCGPGNHVLQLTVSDENNNIKTQQINFTTL
jgi:murein DD-endopeptidase MepM/ murein hydrolase activator NlpD